MAKKIVIIVNILIGLALSGLFVWYQAHQRATGFRGYAQRLGVVALIALAQQEYQKAAVCDEDKDGVGEYGTLEALFRSDGSRPSWVETVFTKYFRSRSPLGDRFDDWILQRDGTVEARDYIYTVLLPDTVDGRERNWCVLAHPWEFTQQTAQTYFLEGRDIRHAYFTVYEGYAGPRRSPRLENVYQGKPFDSDIREYRFPPGPDDRDNPYDEKKMRRAAAKVNKSEGALWIRCQIAYPKGAEGQKWPTEQK